MLSLSRDIDLIVLHLYVNYRGKKKKTPTRICMIFIQLLYHLAQKHINCLEFELCYIDYLVIFSAKFPCHKLHYVFIRTDPHLNLVSVSLCWVVKCHVIFGHVLTISYHYCHFSRLLSILRSNDIRFVLIKSIKPLFSSNLILPMPHVI